MTEFKIDTRLARNDEGEIVKALVETAGFTFPDWDIDWSEIHPHWLMAEYQGKPVGAIQICYGKPVGRLEMLGIDPSIPKPLRAAVVFHIITFGCLTLYEYGAQAVSGMIPFSMPGYKKFAKKHGAVVIDSGNIVLRRVP